MPEQGAHMVIAGDSLDELIKAMKDVGKPSYHLIGGFQEVLRKAYEHTQVRTHVISGRLKASGYTEDDFDGDTWSGTISYGGETGTPAYYAIYELARGGTHDFFGGLDAFHKDFESVIDTHFKALK